MANQPKEVSPAVAAVVIIIVVAIAVVLGLRLLKPKTISLAPPPPSATAPSGVPSTGPANTLPGVSGIPVAPPCEVTQ